jgi:hypothetical protein
MGLYVADSGRKKVMEFKNFWYNRLAYPAISRIPPIIFNAGVKYIDDGDSIRPVTQYDIDLKEAEEYLDRYLRGECE